jgi:heavy metal translocating P-type ATPase
MLKITQFFKIPLLIACGIFVYILLHFVLNLFALSMWWAVFVVVVGSFDLIKGTVKSLMRKQFALDYIAILAIIVGLLSGEYLVALVIVLMLSGGQTLEKYGMAKAKQSLTALTERIPNEVVLWNGGKSDIRRAIGTINVGEEIVVRKGEVVPLDGVLLSDDAVMDESSLTGEPYVMEKVAGDHIRSGTINTGNILVLKVSKPDRDSTYRKIIELVKRAQVEKAPLIRLADRYSTVFTLVTAVIALAAYFFGGYSLDPVLAVLVVATPCPLILATPIALFGGMNSAAKNRVLTKNLSSLEILSRVTAVVLDKTGTITLGQPLVSDLQIVDKNFESKKIYSIAEALERNSLHPLAKAIVAAAREANAPRIFAEEVNENIGSGISARIDGKNYTLAKMTKYHHSNAIELHEEDRVIARFEFEDRLKDDSSKILRALKRLGLSLFIFTGDREENARKTIARLGEVGSLVTVKANCTPEDKRNGVEDLKQSGAVVAMVGDGINDAPALATADVGMVFSNEEHTAASEAADIIFLGGDISSVTFIISIAQKTIRIALESIWFGIGVSICLMILAALGMIPPLLGAILQEGLDVLVILNALRASRLTFRH